MTLLTSDASQAETRKHEEPGLSRDLARMLSRRRTLVSLGSFGGVAMLASCSGGASSSEAATTAATPVGTTTSSSSNSSTTTGSCVAHPTETNGPYPADGSNSANGAVANVLLESGIVRSDIRSSFNGQTGTAEGVELRLKVTLSNVNDSCAPLAGYAIYVWHCTADGNYSVYNLPAQNYLRGVGVTDSNGEIEFTTIVPGCYAGRFPHIHFEVYQSLASATHYNNRLLVSQMAVPKEECAYVYSTQSSVYGNSSRNLSSISINTDNVFRDNSTAEIEAQTLVMSGTIQDGYDATVEVGLAV